MHDLKHLFPSASTLFTFLWIAVFTSVFLWQKIAIGGYFVFQDGTPLRTLLPMLRPVAFNLIDFGGVGDGVTLNTKAFERAVSEISKLRDKGGGQLNVPPGLWLTAPFNLTSHITLFLAQDAVILGIQDEKYWPLMPPLPSYGYGREHIGPRYSSLIHGQNLRDVVITGHNGSINGQGQTWWTKHLHKLLNYTRDSCEDMLIEDCYISVGDDAIAIKSGWDQYGIAYGKPSRNIVIRNLVVRSNVSAGISIGSEMSGGVSNVTIENILVWNSRRAIRIKTAPGRGGYVSQITYRNLTFNNVSVGIVIKTDYNEHPDARYDPKALPVIKDISFTNVRGKEVKVPVRIQGSEEIPIRNVTFHDMVVEITKQKKHIFQCAFVQGQVIGTIFPAPCENFDQYNEQGQLVKHSSTYNVTNIDYGI
ncbi:hypothetical protein TanjilG_07099 [Lupinus angustifolius]|uniref:Pectate lyase superfamily protein domain-containing protein n=1 Tax=Lupinus angustifolius TaxID=3871 RepID=A0A4P1QXQ0_LUPAN|nr:hypothetical protein TanjilG_07099 [Lupinus angustifolius]